MFKFFSLELLVSTIAIAIAVLYMYFKYVIYKYWERKGVRYVEPTFLMGSMGDAFMGKESFGVMYEKFYKKYKKNRYFGIYTVTKPVLVICEPELIRAVFVKNFSNFHNRGIPFNEKLDPLSANLFFLEGSRWKNMRNKMTPTFTSGKMKQMFTIIQSCTDKMENYLENIAKRREIIEVKELCARVTTEIIALTAFGLESNSIENPNSEFRYWGKQTMKSNFKIALRLIAPKILSILRLSVTDKDVTNFFTKAFMDTFEHRSKNNITRPDFVNLLMQLMKQGYVEDDDGKIPLNRESSQGKITIKEALAQSFVFFLAGFETTSSTISYCLYELARECNKEIQEKTRADIDATLKKHDGHLTYEATLEMKYLNKVVNEVLRIYPPAPFLNRQCTKEIELDGTDLKIAKGMDLIIPVLGIHRDPDIYPDPFKFDPERFNDENTAARHPYTYLPFGTGPRNCIGSRFGLLQTKTVLISLLSKFKFSMGPNTPYPLEFCPSTIVLMAKTGIDLLIEPR